MQGNGFRDRIQDFQSAGVRVIGVSLDSVEDNRAFQQAQGYSFALWSDINRSMSLNFGAVEDANASYARRLTFVIGPDGIVEQAEVTKNISSQADALLQFLDS